MTLFNVEDEMRFGPTSHGKRTHSGELTGILEFFAFSCDHTVI